MKKRFTGLLVCLMMLCMSVLAGCSLVETDYDKYYNQVVSVVENKETGKKIEITKKELLQAYQTYGANYVQYYSYTKEQATKQTLELLQNRKININEFETKYNIDRTGKGLTEEEKTYLYTEVVDAINENLKSYYDDIVGTSDSSSTNSDAITFTGYSKNATLSQKDGQYLITRTASEENPLDGFSYSIARDYSNSEDRELIYGNLIENLINDNYKKAFNLYLRDLKMSERGLKLSTATKDIFQREIDRVYGVVYENYALTKYSLLNKNSQGAYGTGVSATQIVNLYSSKVRASYTQYVIEKDSDYDSNVQNKLTETYYFKNDDGSTKFFTVANILFKFTDEQQAEYDAYTKKYEANDGSYSYKEYTKDIDSVFAKLETVVRTKNEETGEYEGEKTSKISLNQVYQNLQNDMKNLQNEGDLNKIGDTINDYIYTYGEDTGMFNATNCYVIGVDSDGNAVSSFVESFNEAGIELYNNGKGEVGDVSALVRSQYGLHILVYTGKCENLFDGIDSSFELNEDAISTLYTTRINPLVDKTYFDLLYDEIYTDNYQYFENANTNILREKYKITQYSARFKDMF